MKINKIIKILIFSTLLFGSAAIFAELNVVTTFPYIADIAKKIGGDKIAVDSLAQGHVDPHFIVPKPSLIAKTRSADLVIINGADLEIGWMPPILNGARNAKVQPGEDGFLNLSDHVKLIQVPDQISRAQGDMHPQGNPHFYLNPDNVILIAKVIKVKLCELDTDNCPIFTANFDSFKIKWDSKVAGWKEELKTLQGKKMIQYHRLFDYFTQYFGINIVGELEPLPGIPPTSKHISLTIKKAQDMGAIMILQDVYHPAGPSELVSKKTGIKVTPMPHDVKAVEQAQDIFTLYDEIVRRLKK